jgi:diguanylate cyclase (GGDEF)-like protein
MRTAVKSTILAMPPAWLAILLPAAHFTTIALSYHYELWALWIVNSFLLVALLRNRTETWPALALLAALADFAVSSAMWGPKPTHLIHVAADTAVPLLIATALRAFASQECWYRSLRWMFKFLLFTIASMALVTLMMMFAGSVFLNRPFTVPGWLNMVRTGSLGVILGVPFLLCWTESELRSKLNTAQIIETSILTGAIGALSYLTFTYPLPVLFLVFPALMITTLRCGLIGATAGTLTAAVFGSWYTAQGTGPFYDPSFTLQQKLLFVQLYFLATIISTLPLAIILALRQTITARLARESEISAAALENMAQGLCMFDAEGRLITCNGNYAEIYGLPVGLAASGTSSAEILRHQIGVVRAGTPPDYVDGAIDDPVSQGEHCEIELHDGRIIDIRRRQLPSRGWVSTHQDVTDSRRAAHRITHLANHDPLTDLPNRAFFGDRLRRSMAQSQSGQGFALHCIDLDKFKEVNDTLGHGAGDELLTQVALRLRVETDGTDLVGRLGGDEFAIIQSPLKSLEEASELATRVIKSLSESFEVHGHEILIGASVGISVVPGDSIDSTDLMQKGDLALYRAKMDGRGTFRFFEAGMDTMLRNRRLLESELKAAIHNGEFELYYQPILNTADDLIEGFEALVRWHHPQRGILLPCEFIEIAEQTGLIVAIGEWAIREACREAAGWPESTWVAVNLSAAQFKSRGLVGTIASALATAGLAPERLELEVTENVLLQETSSILATLKQISQLGVSLAMDDFGTGYSSLSYLRTFPFKKVKIDQSFVRELGKSECRAIIDATLDLSNKLGLTTTAEGVETAEQLTALRRSGCTNIQGFHIGAPAPARSAADLLSKQVRGGDKQTHRAA